MNLSVIKKQRLSKADKIIIPILYHMKFDITQEYGKYSLLINGQVIIHSIFNDHKLISLVYINDDNIYRDFYKLYENSTYFTLTNIYGIFQNVRFMNRQIPSIEFIKHVNYLATNITIYDFFKDKHHP